MNEGHEELCSSADWGAYLAGDVMPRVLEGVDLGDHVLEVGPGFGLATDVLRTMVDRVTSVEIDPAYAARLSDRFEGTNVHVVEGDATALDFDDASFTAATSFTMLHHVPTPDLQDKLFAEVARVLTDGSPFVGSDSLDSPGFRDFHAGDICDPVDAHELPGRLEAAGFTPVEVTVEWADPAEGDGDEEAGGTVFFIARKGNRPASL